MSQLSYSQLWEGYESDAAAKAARDEAYRAFKANGQQAHRFTLRNQLKKYDGFGQPNGASGNVYMLNVRD